MWTKWKDQDVTAHWFSDFLVRFSRYKLWRTSTFVLSIFTILSDRKILFLWFYNLVIRGKQFYKFFMLLPKNQIIINHFYWTHQDNPLHWLWIFCQLVLKRALRIIEDHDSTMQLILPQILWSIPRSLQDSNDGTKCLLSSNPNPTGSHDRDDYCSCCWRT